MEDIVIILAFAMALLLLDVTSLRWGVDSRPSVGDDHRR